MVSLCWRALVKVECFRVLPSLLVSKLLVWSLNLKHRLLIGRYFIYMAIVCIEIPTPTQKHHPLFLTRPPLKSTIYSSLSSLLFRNPLLYIGFSWYPPESPIFQWTSKILQFFILNTIYLLKLTKFWGKISQFEFIVMTEKNIFAYKHFFLLNISDFNTFLCENYNPLPEKCHPLLSLQNPLKLKILSHLPCSNFLWMFNSPLPPTPAEWGRGHYDGRFMNFRIFMNLVFLC